MRSVVRQALRQPKFALGVTATLASGIGATVLVFAVLNAVVLRPLPYRDPSQLAMLWADDVKRGIHEEGVGFPTVMDWRQQSQVFEDFAVCGRGGSAILSDQSEPQRIELGVVSANLWSVLGVAPSLGRAFTDAEDRQSARVAVISHGLWRRRFSGRREAIGRQIELDGVPYQVIGVMRESFQFPSRQAEAWIPLPVGQPYARIRERREMDYFKVVGRLAPGRTLEDARREMDEIGRRLTLAYPTSDPDFAGYAVSVYSFDRQYVGPALPRALWLLFGAVGLVLLVACANAASLLLARNMARQREFSVRAAIGASARALLREEMALALALAAMAGLTGAFLGWAMLRGLMWAAAHQLPRLEDASIDGHVLAVAAGASLLTALVCGPAAAWRASRADPGHALRGGGRGIAESRRLQFWLAGGQAALAVMLLTGSGLMVRSLMQMQRVDPGFRIDGTALLRVDRSWTPAGQEPGPAFWQRLLERLNAIPGLRAGAVGEFVMERNPDETVTVEGRPLIFTEQIVGDFVTPGFFEAAGVRLRSGRFFTADDFRAGPLRTMIINQTMARRLWPGEDAVGKRMQFGARNVRDRWITVVGVVDDMRRLGPERPAVCEAFGPGFRDAMDLLVRASPPRADMLAEVRAAIREIDARVPVHSVTPLKRLVDESTLPRRLQTGLLGAFAGLTLLLAAVGLFATLQQTVLDRRAEFGIRMALGATPAAIGRLVLARALAVGVAGAGAGALAAFWMSRMLEALLFEVQPHDAWAMAAAPLTVLLTSLAAGVSPAWRALRVDPARALNE